MGRIPFPDEGDMTPEQRKVVDAVVSGPRGMLIGPLRAALHRPELAAVWQEFGSMLRFGTSLPPHLSELAILVTARRWNSQVEWYVHAQMALKAGLDARVVETLRTGGAPQFADEEAAAVYEFARELQTTGEVTEHTYARVRDRWGAIGVVELTTLIGYYTLVSMTLNAHHIPLPNGVSAPLPPPATADTAPAPGSVLTEIAPSTAAALPFAARGARMTGAFEPVSPRMPSPPGRPLPGGACDVHTHVFGPFDRFPVPAPSSYAPPTAPPHVHQEMLDRAGFARAVLIQPAPYGTDNSALVAALSGRPEILRGVAVLDAGATDADMQALHAAGVRGLRFSEMRDPRGGGRYKGSVGVEDYIRLAPRMRALGWLPHVWAKCADLAGEILPKMVGQGLPVVIDHLASINTARGVADPAFQSVLGYLADGRVWIKLSLCRNSTAAPGYDDERPFHDALIRANPDRLLWGSDWPFVRMYDKSPDVGWLIDVFDAWVDDEALRSKILVANPARLYGFEEQLP